MATIDLGKIKQVWRGTYNNSTAYTVDDLVAYTDTVGGLQNTSTYIAVANTTGNAPASGGSIHASWNLVAQGVPDRIPSQSGNAGKVLKTDGSALSFGSGSLIERVYHWCDDTQSCSSGNASGSGTGVNVFTYTITAKTANPIYRLDWTFFWGNSGTADSNEVHAIAGVFKHASNTGLSNLAYGFGYKGGSRANSTFRAQTNDYILFDSDAGTGNDGDANWSAQMNHVSAYGNIATFDTGSIGKCGDDSTQSVSAGDTLYLRAWIGSHSDGCYGRTQGQTSHMAKAQVILTEFNSSGQ